MMTIQMFTMFGVTVALYFVKTLSGYSNSRDFMATGVKLSDGKFHHLCVTWQSSNGSFDVYVNGSVAFRTTTGSGKRLPGGGYWVIGQDQDSVGGLFDRGQAFVGEVSEVHVWNRVLSPAEIKVLASSCAQDLKGNYIAYNNFTIKGNVPTFKPPCCK